MSGQKSVLDFPPYIPYPSNLAYRERICPHVDIKKESFPTPLGFVDKLINQADYQSALLEMDRLTYFHYLAENEIFTRKLKCFIGLNNLERGIYYYENTITPFPEKYPDTQLQAAVLYYKAESYHKVIQTLKSENLGLSCDSSYISKANAMQGVAAFGMDDQPNSAIYFEKSYTFNPDTKTQYEKNNQLLLQWENFNPKRPKMARFMSIIPGLGYWYSGHKGSAISAFLFDTIFGFATYTSFRRGNYGVGALFGILSTTFYIGNIRGAGTSAERYNRIHKKQIQEELENNNLIFINY